MEGVPGGVYEIVFGEILEEIPGIQSRISEEEFLDEYLKEYQEKFLKESMGEFSKEVLEVLSDEFLKEFLNLSLEEYVFRLNTFEYILILLNLNDRYSDIP